ncbi:translesion DNA synthesis-associated protein ImuA [Burkholderia sp. Ac-20365]|uniref:translesion DNA synthesis-associated protein ImuA n=1 Tax=Burkholderia sp. Ac-20365 TaxID=2703897 RepID=UPI00197C1E36|nr:translesion DNA synthesis-associated protein ImuA [Burkholderia sp. Ac-20365]MBN3762334.1 translesion DNA synthesis-associated protein ImuA [Burkholderia sp. Ac-20365]
MNASSVCPEDIHPSIWRASQLAHGRGRVVETGYPVLSREFPGGGWPVAALVDLLVQQAGIGEFRLLRPALTAIPGGSVALVNAPHLPDGLGLHYIGVPVERVMLVKAANSGDALWSVEQILRAGTCSAVIFWAQHVKDSSLRRLHLAAQSTESIFVMVRPLASSQDSSPATLRLALRPTHDGLVIDIVKRRGPVPAGPISVTLQPTPVLFSNRGRAAKPVREGADYIVGALERAHV